MFLDFDFDFEFYSNLFYIYNLYSNLFKEDIVLQMLQCNAWYSKCGLIGLS